MTTIAYREGILAADSLVTQGATKAHGNYQKIRRIGEYLVGTAGCIADSQAFLEWLQSEDASTTPPPKGEYGALIVGPKGRVREIENGSVLPSPRGAKFYALGSGGPFALAAMYAGATATEAVKIAAKIDTSTGLSVRSLKI